MEAVYLILFTLFAVPAAFLEYSDNACFGLLRRHEQHKPEYLRFRNNYVLIFSLMMGGCGGRRAQDSPACCVLAWEWHGSCARMLLQRMPVQGN